ncbi:MAG: GNAT family N-acetyltransferase [Iamia sp.]
MTPPDPALLPTLVAPTAGIRLRPWGEADAGALVAAWHRPDIAGRSRGSDDRSLAAAARWIAGAEARAAAGLAVDLVVGPLEGDAVWGEVGVVRRQLRAAGQDPDVVRTVWEVGWWVVPTERGRGLASAAVALLGAWAGGALDITGWVARIEPTNRASHVVARAAGMVRRGRFDADHDLWAGAVPGSPPVPGGPV